MTTGILADCEHRRRGSQHSEAPSTCAFSVAYITVNTYQLCSIHTRYSNRRPVIGLGGGRSPVTRRIGERGSSWSGGVRTQSARITSGPSGRRRLSIGTPHLPSFPPGRARRGVRQVWIRYVRDRKNEQIQNQVSSLAKESRHQVCL